MIAPTASDHNNRRVNVVDVSLDFISPSLAAGPKACLRKVPSGFGTKKCAESTAFSAALRIWQLAIVLTRFAVQEWRNPLPPYQHARALHPLCNPRLGRHGQHGPCRRAEPFKDDLFAYPATLSSSDDGAYRVIDYRELRDVNGRDADPGHRAKDIYVSLGVDASQKDLVLKSSVGDVRFIAVGRTEGASIITLYIHGLDGSRTQGVDDFTFGGNFNRVKNLMVDNGGLYVSPDFSDFGRRGTAELAALIDHYATASPSAKVFVACGSGGGDLCWSLAANERVAARLSGLVLLGSVIDDDFMKSAAFRKEVPVLFAYGSRDRFFSIRSREALFRALRAANGAYPARFLRFEGGTHGTPLRMIDWRETLNWMMSVGQ